MRHIYSDVFQQVLQEYSGVLLLIIQAGVLFEAGAQVSISKCMPSHLNNLFV